MFDFKLITLFCLEKRLSKQETTIFSKNLGRPWPLWPPLATPMFHRGTSNKSRSLMLCEKKPALASLD